ncbi:hypothetical protein QU481_18445 [Crenobacter sp. SG2303]|uniref:Glycosyltransferase RgtA/B/C/D-like domain-containing protein n=1 Tax=Crenobacter oryzisoli TaxID=3056844 RepID=A0ABT7XSR0_9NEIS|nr:hypothetical protein [Crenobacter sp. SG2303]MDN0076830.1 hypothetical protein [Crenobacter sp. SG2303]
MKNIGNFLRKYRPSLLVAFVFLFFTLTSFSIYLTRTLNDDINNHILAGDMFGVPSELREHGVKPLYYGPGQTGWDGQFYYYIANDILALKDTANHIDAPSYRYQRVGLSLFVAIVSAITGNNWVSPSTFFVSYFCLLLVATLVGASLFVRFGLSPFLILLWSLSVGTQITLFNALPDAAADAFLIIALWLAVSGRLGWSTIPFVLSSLSREVYVLFPSFIAFFYLFQSIKTKEDQRGWKLINGLSHFFVRSNYIFLLLPGIVAICWRLYISNHFGVTPSSQAQGILGTPFVAWFKYLLSGVSDNHILVGSGFPSYAEAGSLILFIMVLGAALFSAWKLINNRVLSSTPELGGIALATGSLVALYVCFGPTVMSHYTGYFKALSVFSFLIPLLLASIAVSRLEKLGIYSLLLLSLFFSTFYNMKVRILPFDIYSDEIIKMSAISNHPPIKCFNDYDAEIKINSVTINKGSTISNYIGRGTQIVVDLDLKNTGDNPFWSTNNIGGVFMSYQWVDSERRVLLDGVRSVIPGGLLPGQTKRVSVISSFPADSDASLMLSPVQEGCAWFYQANPKVSGEFKISVK